MTSNELIIVVTTKDQATQGMADIRTALVKEAKVAGQAFGSAFKAALLDALGDLGTMVGDQLRQDMRRAGDRAGDSLADGVTDGASDAGEQAGREIAEEIVERVRRAGDQAGDRLEQELREAGEDAGEAAGREIADGIGDGIDNAGGDAEAGGGQVGGGLMAGLTARLASGGGAIGEALSGAVAGAGAMVVAAAAAVAVAAGAALVKGIGLAIEKEDLEAKLAAQLGSPELAGGFGKIAGKLYAKGFGESLGEVQQAVRYMWQAGIIDDDATNAEIQSVTQSVMTLAEVFDQDLKEAARAVGQMVRTGLVKDGKEAADVLTRMFSSHLNTDDLLETMNEYSTQFRELGVSGPKALGMIYQMLKGGARDTDMAADALKEFAVLSKNGSKSSAEAFEALGLNAKKMFHIFAKGGPEADKAMKEVVERLKNMKDPVAQDAAAVALFGGKAEDLGDALYAIDPENAVNAMGDIAGAADRAGESLHDSLGARWEKVKRTFEMGLTEVGEKFLELFDRFTESDAFQEYWGKVKEIWEEDIRPLLKDLAEWFEEKIMPILEKFVKKYLNAMVDKLQEVRDKFKEHKEEYETLYETLKVVAEWILEKIIPLFGEQLIDSLETGIDTIKIMIDVIGEFIAALLWLEDKTEKAAGWIKDRWNDMIGWFKKLPGRMKSATSGMWDGIKDAFKSAINWIIDRWNNLRFKVPGVAGWDGVTIDTPNIRHLATGGIHGGWAMVGEDGRELVKLPHGSTTIPHGQTEAMLAGGGGQVQVMVSAAPSASRDLVAAILEVLRFEVRSRFGGSAQAALGVS